MRKLVTFPAVLVFMMVVFQSCSKTSSKDFAPPAPARPDKVINAVVNAGATYTIAIDQVGELSIKTQAHHFRVSEAETDPKTGLLTYTYSPVEGFKGSDEVLLAHKTEYIYSGNSSCTYGSNSAIGSRISYIAIRLNVSE